MRNSEINSRSVTANSVDAVEMKLDEHTLRDLEIFESSSIGPSLFELCNLTRTDGGVEVLRRRMENPWANAENIRATQDAIVFIMSLRDVFSKLPSYITRHAQQYQREILVIATQANRLEFAIGAMSLWINHDRHYQGIVRGVQITSGLIRQLREFLSQPELDQSLGELAPLIAEMRELVASPLLEKVPDKDVSQSWFWPILRMDQTFRIHNKGTILRILELIYELDALVAMAEVTRKYGFVMPTVEQGPLSAQAQGLVHLFVKEPIANPLQLNQQSRVLFLTGPNMAGKTTYMRAFATALYLAHLGMGVPAAEFRFSPAQRMFSSINLSDDLRSGVSYFRAEALRVKAVAEAIALGYRVVALMDEPFKGTNVKDALDASLSILKRFADMNGCLFMFSSHLIELGDHIASTCQIRCVHFEAGETEGSLQFDYRLHDGISTQRLGVRVLVEEGVFALLDAANKLRQKSKKN